MTQSDTLFETARDTPRRIALRALPIDPKRPFRRLLATLTAGVTALSLMAASAVPAHADRQSDNLAKALIAALAIGAIVNSIDKGKAKPAPQPVRNPVVPAVCAIEVSGARRDVTFYPETCLRAEGFKYRLPRDCAISIRIRGKVDRAYGQLCLRDAGFRVGGRHDRRTDRRVETLDRWRLDDDTSHGGGRPQRRGHYGH